MKLNTTHDVFRALADGRKVRKTGWDPSQFVHIGNTGKIVTENDDSFALCFNPYTEWELFEEPKKMKQVWQWGCRLKGNKDWFWSSHLVDEQKIMDIFGDLYEVLKISGPYEVPE